MAEATPLDRAWKLYRNGSFQAALELLEPKIFQYRESPDFFRTLGLCCLRQGDWKGGETYLERSRQLETEPHKETLFGLMAVAARRGDLGAAVKTALELMDRYPTERRARAALDKLRLLLSGSGPTPAVDRVEVQGWLAPYRASRPGLGRWAVRAGLGVAGVLVLAAGTWGVWQLAAAVPSSASRPGPSVLTQTVSAAETLVPGTGYRLTLSADEVAQGWDRARKAFQNYQDSLARYEINRLLLSNASALTKERARGLLPYLHEPNFARPEDSSDYAGVKAAPELYEGCTVRWSGVITNLVSGTTSITFDLLLGYETGQVVQGIVPVELTFAALLKNAQIVEVLGRVALRDGRWLIQGTSLRELGYRTP